METLGINGVQLAYRIHGEGDPVVLLSGTGMPPDVWDFLLVPALNEAGYQAVTFAARGVAPSDGPSAPYSVAGMAEESAELIEQLGIDKCHVLGVSLGGFIAEELARTRPELVSSAILISSAGPATAFARARMEAEREMFHSADVPEGYDFIDALSSLLPPKTLQEDDTTVQNWVSILKGGSASAWAGDGRRGQYEAVWAWLLADDVLGRYRQMSMASLLIGFEHDLIFPPRTARQAAESIPKGEFLEIGGAAHGGLITKADQWRPAVLDFLARR